VSTRQQRLAKVFSAKRDAQFIEKSGELTKHDDYAKIHDHTDEEHISDRSNMIRLYSTSRDVFSFQIRCNNPIHEYGRGRDRFLIGQCYLSKDEIQQMLDYATRKSA
jgi:hypothetical protein